MSIPLLWATKQKMGTEQKTVTGNVDPVAMGNLTNSRDKTPFQKCTGSELHPKCGRFMAKCM